MINIFCVGFAFKIFILFGFFQEIDGNKKRKEKIDFNNEHMFWEPRGEPPNKAAIEESSRIT